MTQPDWYLDQQVPAVPETAEELVIRWAKRDAEYAKQRPLNADVVVAIRAARKREAWFIADVGERARLWARAETWTPPARPEFGSLHSWLEED